MASVAVLRGKRRERLVGAWFASMVVLAVVLGIALFVFARERDPLIVQVGTVDQFPPGSVTLVQLDTRLPEFARVQITQAAKFPHAFRSPIPVYIVHAEDGAWYAWYQYDPRNSCAVSWQLAEKKFIEACHGSAYERNGEYVRSPSARNLNGFRVDVQRDGTISLDPRSFKLGASNQ